MSDRPQYEFRSVKLHSPHENICAAVAIIQSYILGQESARDAESMFGFHNFTGADLEAAVAMLVPVVEVLETTRWNAEAEVTA